MIHPWSCKFMVTAFRGCTGYPKYRADVKMRSVRKQNTDQVFVQTKRTLYCELSDLFYTIIPFYIVLVIVIPDNDLNDNNLNKLFVKY